MDFPEGGVVVSLSSLSRKRDNGLSACRNIDSIFVIWHIFKLKSGTKKRRKKTKEKDVDNFLR